MSRMFKIIDTHQPAEAERDRRWAGWIRRMAKGDTEALAALYDESATMLFGLVLQILSSRQRAEDTLLDIYNHARQNARKFDPRKQTALDWLIALSRDLAIERLRSVSSIADTFNQKRDLANLALAELSEEQRCILEMTYLGGLTADEVAAQLAASRAYVTKQIVFGLKKLKMCSYGSVAPDCCAKG